MKAMAWALVAAGALAWGGTAAGQEPESGEGQEGHGAGMALTTMSVSYAEMFGTPTIPNVPEVEVVLGKEDAAEGDGEAAEAAKKGAAEAVEWLSAAGRGVGAEAAYAGALEGVLRAGDPGVKIVSREEWEAKRAEEESVGDEALETEELPGGFGYAKVRVLTSGAAKRLGKALEGWQKDGAAGAVLDLRGASGTSAGAADEVAMGFTGVGVLLRESASGGDAVKFTSVDGGKMSIPVMVLVDGGTRRGAEMLSAELKGSCRGTLLIGQVTAGDPLVREPRDLPDGRVALLPARTLKVADGTVYDGDGGVEPDVVLSDDDKTADAYEPKSPLTLRRNKRGELEEEKVDRALRERIGTDGFLRRAVDILLGLQAMGK